MTPLDYHCKMCGKGGVVYYQENVGIKDIEAWRNHICCKRCYAFHDSYHATKRAIEKLCISLIAVRQMRDGEAIEEACKEIRERLTKLTQRIDTLCSDYYRVQNIWKMEMVLILMDKPDGCNKVVNTFRVGYERQSPVINQEPQEQTQLAAMA